MGTNIYIYYISPTNLPRHFWSWFVPFSQGGICFLSLEGNITSHLRNIEAPKGVVVNISNTAKASPEAEAPTVAAPIGPVAGAVHGIMVSNPKCLSSKYGHVCLLFVFLLFYMYIYIYVMLQNYFIISTCLIYNTFSDMPDIFLVHWFYHQCFLNKTFQNSALNV